VNSKVNYMYIIGNQSDYTVQVQLIGAYKGSHNASEPRGKLSVQ
jgi:hypothetical protein